MVLLPDFRVRQRDYLLEISRAMTAQLDVGEVLRMILQSSVKMLAGEVGMIALREPTGAFYVRALFGVGPEAVEAFKPLLPDGSDSVDGLYDGPDFDDRLQDVALHLEMPLRQAVAIPMSLGDESIGVIYVFRSFTGTATHNDHRVLQSFADQAAVAVHNARLYQQVDQERKRLEGLLEYSADGVMILDASRHILSFNKVMSQISGWQADKVIGQPYDTVIQWASHPEGRDLSDAIKDGWPVCAHLPERPTDTLYVEGDILRPDGTTIGVGITYAPLFEADNRLLNIMVNVRDITHFREAQQMKSTFIGVVSHELKTPVALIKGYASTLRREDANWDASVIQQSLSVIEDEADRLTELIENLLAASKLQAEGMRLNYEDVSFEAMINSVVERIQAQAENHKIVVAFDKGFPVIPGDSIRLRQVVENLVNNAVKYSPQGGIILIRGSFTDDDVLISIQDEGVGLPQDEWERIFERFYRVDDNLTRRTQGTGLGLYLARAVIEAHGGEIGVQSVPNQGATFYFSVPRHRAY